jgi:hypothetical protein
MACLLVASTGCGAGLGPSVTTIAGGSNEVAFFDTATTLGGETAFVYDPSTNTATLERLRMGVDGTAATPNIQVSFSDPNSGIFAVAADTWGVSAGGVECARFLASGVVLNVDQNAAYDFMARSSGREEMLFVDAGNDRVGVGGLPLTAFEVNDPADGTTSLFSVETTEVVVNEDSASMDFRVEGGSDANLLFCDGSEDRVGIGTATPLVPLHVNLGAGTAPAMGNTGLLIQNNTNTGDPGVLTILSGATANTNINFANASSATAAQIRFANATNLLAFAVGGAAIITCTSTGEVGVNVGFATPAGRLEIVQASGDTDLILRNTVEAVGTSGASVEFAVGSAAAALAATNQLGRIVADITQATPSALQAEMDFYVNTGDSIDEVFSLGVTESVFNDAGDARDFRVEGDTDANAFIVDASGDNAGVGIAVPAAKLHVYQNDGTGAIPCLELEQDDTDEPFIEFDGGSAGDLSTNITTLTTESVVGHIRVSINGTDRWIAFSDTPV